MPIDDHLPTAARRRTACMFVALGALLLLVVPFLTACADIEDAEAAAPDAIEDHTGGLQPGEQVPELSEEVIWLNSGPAAFMESFIESGSVVLVDFWSHSCVDCLRSLPAVADWHQRYGAHGLTVIGVHAPAFRFEENLEAIQEAVVEQGIPYPVVQDNDHAVWTAFENEAWPARYVVGADGTIAHQFVGEGGYADTESAIRAALDAAGYDLTGVPPGYAASSQELDQPSLTSRDLYFGYRHNYHPAGVYAAQPDYYSAPEEPIAFEDPGPPREEGLWYAHGMWSVEEDALVHAREATTTPDYVVFEFNARSVTLVMESPLATPATPGEVTVQLDGFPIPPDLAGADVRWNDEGHSIVTVDEPRIYDILELPQQATHSMRISTQGKGLSLYLASFSADIDQP